MEDLHSTHIYMDSISWGTRRKEDEIRPPPKKHETTQHKSGGCVCVCVTLTQPSGFHAGGSVDRVSKKAVPRHGQTHHPGNTGPWKHKEWRHLSGSNMESRVGHLRLRRSHSPIYGNTMAVTVLFCHQCEAHVDSCWPIYWTFSLVDYLRFPACFNTVVGMIKT